MAAIIDGCDAVIGAIRGRYIWPALKSLLWAFRSALPEQLGLSELDAKVIADREIVGCQTGIVIKTVFRAYTRKMYSDLYQTSVNDGARDAFLKFLKRIVIGDQGVARH